MILLVFIAVLLLIVTLFGFVAWILFLHQKKRAAFDQQLKQVKNDYEKELLKTELEIQETTFQYISQEIHDNIGQQLSLSKLQLNTIDLNLYPALKDKIEHATALQTTALDDLRDLSRSLSSELIRDAGLEAAIAFQINQLKKTTAYTVTFNVEGDYEELDEQQEMLIFRIIQEAFNNILHHAQGSEIQVRLRYESGTFQLLISDNGKGFDGSTAGTGSGISNMRKRASMMKASFEITSAPGTGTRINLIVSTTQDA